MPPSSCNLLRWLPRDFPAPGHPGSVCVRGFWSRPTSPSSPFHLSCYFLDLQTQPGVQGAFPLPLGLMGPEPRSPHSPGRAGGLASHREAWAWRKQASEEREGESSLPSSHLQPAAPTPNPVWALFPTLVSLAPLTDDPVPTLILAQLQGSPVVKSGDQGSLWIRWWVVPSLKWIQLPAWWD